MKSNEWYTPAPFIEAAREVMGDIDLDPASCAQANETVKAARFYTQAENGLALPWYGRVWLNPPYSRLDTGPFIKKLVHEYAEGNVEQAVCLLLGNACFTRWFQPLWDYPLCFYAGTINFHRPDGSRGRFGFGSTFVYLGPHRAKFTSVFKPFGRIVTAAPL